MKKFLKERDDDLVLLAKFTNSIPAHSLRILLEASGIRASVTGEEANANFGSAIGMLGLNIVGVEVHVRREDLEDAKLVMNEVPAASDVLIAEWKCGCGAEVDEGFAVCWSCGREFDSPK